jgi:hypothetical protein
LMENREFNCFLRITPRSGLKSYERTMNVML